MDFHFEKPIFEFDQNMNNVLKYVQEIFDRLHYKIDNVFETICLYSVCVLCLFHLYVGELF